MCCPDATEEIIVQNRKTVEVTNVASERPIYQCACMLRVAVLGLSLNG